MTGSVCARARLSLSFSTCPIRKEGELIRGSSLVGKTKAVATVGGIDVGSG